MGLGGVGPLQLLIVLALVLLIFGTKKLRNFGSDLGGAIKGFKKAMAEDEEAKQQDKLSDGDSSTIDVNAEKVEDKQ